MVQDNLMCLWYSRLVWSCVVRPFFILKKWSKNMVWYTNQTTFLLNCNWCRKSGLVYRRLSFYHSFHQFHRGWWLVLNFVTERWLIIQSNTVNCMKSMIERKWSTSNQSSFNACLLPFVLSRALFVINKNH